MSRRLLPLFALAALLVPGTPLVAQRPGAVQAVLLHKGQDAFVHAVPLQPGFLLTFTVPSTGVMKPVLKTEPQTPASRPAGGGHGALAARLRQPPGELIAGVAVDDERMYVLTATRVFQSAPATEDRGGERDSQRGPGGGPPGAPEAAPELKLLGHQFKLHAFSLKDGDALMGQGYELPLVNEDPKASEPPDTTKVKETLGKGQIKLVPGGLKCRGTTVIFSGNDVKSLEVKGKQFTPPPGFFIREPNGRIG